MSVFKNALAASLCLLIASMAIVDGSRVSRVRMKSGDHGDDDGEAVSPEWGGLFETPENFYSWHAQKTEEGAPDDGSEPVGYLDPSMKIVVFSVAEDTDEALEEKLALAEELFNVTGIGPVMTEVEPGETLTPSLTKCYQLHFDGWEDWSYQSLYQVDATGADHLVFYAQHHPVEFKNDHHYLKDNHGDDIEPVHEYPEPVASGYQKRWGKAIGAVILVIMVTFSGVVFLVPGLEDAKSKNEEAFICITNAFAAGAILATAFYLILYESTHYVTSYWPDNETDSTWRWGTVLMAGIVMPWVVNILVWTVAGQKINSIAPAAKDVEGGAETTGESFARVVGAVLIGDFFHNFVDGIMIGTAFSHCSDSKAWAITAATVGHEVAQELGDYCVLTGPTCNLSKVKALAFNFLSGFSVLFGTIAIMSNDVDNGTTGLLLAFGGGTYIAIGCCECMPLVFKYSSTSVMRSVLSLLAFTVGAVAIGLVLLDHGHCSADSEGGGDGHNH